MPTKLTNKLAGNEMAEAALSENDDGDPCMITTFGAAGTINEAESEEVANGNHD